MTHKQFEFHHDRIEIKKYDWAHSSVAKNPILKPADIANVRLVRWPPELRLKNGETIFVPSYDLPELRTLRSQLFLQKEFYGWTMEIARHDTVTERLDEPDKREGLERFDSRVVDLLEGHSFELAKKVAQELFRAYSGPERAPGSPARGSQSTDDGRPLP